jgi:hypothetical protein
MPQLVVQAAVVELLTAHQVVRLVTLVVTLLLKDTLVVVTVHLQVPRTLQVVVAGQVRLVLPQQAHRLQAMAALEE